MLEIDPILTSRTLFRQTQAFEVEHVDRTPLRRSAPDVRLEVVVGKTACCRQNVDDEFVDHPDHAGAARSGSVPHGEWIVGAKRGVELRHSLLEHIGQTTDAGA